MRLPGVPQFPLQVQGTSCGGLKVTQPKVKFKVTETMDRYNNRGDNGGERTSFNWPTKPANPRYVRCNLLSGLTGLICIVSLCWLS